MKNDPGKGPIAGTSHPDEKAWLQTVKKIFLSAPESPSKASGTGIDSVTSGPKSPQPGSPSTRDVDPTLLGSTPPHDDPDHDRDDQDRSDPDGDPVERSAGRESALCGVPQSQLEADAEDRGRKLDQEKHPPGQVNESTDRDPDRS